MSNVQSYNALIDRFKAFASGHFILKRFSHGQIEVSDLEKFGEYPFMHVVPSNVTYAKGMKTFSFQIVLADMPRDKEDKSEYQREVLSDLQRIAEDLVAEITNHRVLFGDLITVNNVSLEPFLEEFQHTLTGWTISLNLLVPYYWDACSIPAEWNDFFESGSGGTGSILTFIDSITRDENGNVSLVNDEAEPSPNYYYGTNDEGVRGWYLLETGGGLTCETIGDCQTIIDIEAAIDDLQEEILLKANTADISAVGFSNDYNDLDNKPTIPNAQVNSDWNATSGVAEILNKPTIPTATSDLTNDGEDGVNPFITAQDLPSLTGYVPYTGATQNVDLGTHTLSAKDLVINHSSGSGVAASITKGGAGEALTVNKTSGSGNAMSVTGGVTQLSELHLTTDLADAYIASAATWNAKFNLPALTSGSVLFSNGTTIAQDNANLFWDDTNNRLGIGTASPSSILNIGAGTDNANVRSAIVINNDGYSEPTTQGTTANGDKFVFYNSSSFGKFSQGLNTSFGWWHQAVGEGAYHSWITGSNGIGSERMRISVNGNVGIGTTNPNYILDVNGSGIDGLFAIRIKNTNATGQQTAEFRVENNLGSSGRMFILGSSFVTYKTLSANDLGFYKATSGNISILNDVASGRILLTAGASSSAHQIIFANGNIGIGTTTDAGYRLDVNGTARIVNKLSVGTPSAASALMEITSTTLGFLPPRMTNAQKLAISSPAAGLIVYDTTLNKLCVRTASSWETITSI